MPSFEGRVKRDRKLINAVNETDAGSPKSEEFPSHVLRSLGSLDLGNGDEESGAIAIGMRGRACSFCRAEKGEGQLEISQRGEL